MENVSQEETNVVYTQKIDDAVELKVVQVGAYWVESRPKGMGLGNANFKMR